MAVFELVKDMLEWRVTDSWDEENNRILEGCTTLIYKGGDRRDPANYRQIICLPMITKIVTLAIHKRMRRLFGSVEASILECEQRGVRTSQGCKEAVIENLAITEDFRKYRVRLIILRVCFKIYWFS